MDPNDNDWSPNSKNMCFFLMDSMEQGLSPRLLLQTIDPTFYPPYGLDELTLWRLLVARLAPPSRTKLIEYNTIDDAVNLINRSKKILVLSGAGISTSAGLPDFRSRKGIYVQIHAQHKDLGDPGLMFDVDYFRHNPLPFYQFAKALFPGQYSPTAGHKFIKCLEDQGKLLRNYTQNIDTLEKQAGIQRVIECHGSFAKATCTNCNYEIDGHVIKEDIMQQKVPLCPKCCSSTETLSDKFAVMKPNIIFFGEQLGEEYHNSIESDKREVDLLIVIGSSLKVKPVAMIPQSIRPDVPQILINREPLGQMRFDIELLGNCDDIVQQLCLRLGGDWTRLCESNSVQLKEIAFPPEIMKAALDPKQDHSQQDRTNRVENDKADAERASTSSQQDNITQGMSGLRTTSPTIAPSEATNCKMTDSPDENLGDATQKGPDSGSKLDHAQNSNDVKDKSQEEDVDWGSEQHIRSFNDVKPNIEIPSSSYYFIKPNVYLFPGAEITKSKLASLEKKS